MAEFTPINSQEEFDARLKDRLERERNTVRKEFADYETVKNSLSEKTKALEELTGKVSGFEAQIKDLTTKLSASETGSAKKRIAYETGLPFELCERLNGSTEEEIRSDAQRLKELIIKNQPVQPMYKPEKKPEKSTDAYYSELLNNLNNK